MLSLGFAECLAATVVLLISFAVWPQKTRTFRRQGWEPGLLGLKVWPARVWFFFKGHGIVERAYYEVPTSLDH